MRRLNEYLGRPNYFYLAACALATFTIPFFYTTTLRWVAGAVVVGEALLFVFMDDR